MIPTSDKYKENINADTELFVCEAELTFVPPGADEGVTIQSSAESELSFKNQITNGDFNMSSKWGSLEHNRIKLDGSVSFIPPDGSQQVGYWSKEMCGEDYVFVSRPQIQYIMTKAYDIVGVSIAFDDLGNEYATELDIAYYGAINNFLQSVSYTNTDTLFYADQRHTGVKKIVLTVKKWNVPGRMCKVCQIVPGVILSFGSEGIYSFESEETIEPFSSSVTVPQNTIVFDNTDGEFNVVNPDGLISYLRQKMKTVPKLRLVSGTRTDSIQMGKFYLYSWPQNDNSGDVSITCRPSIAFESSNYTLTANTLQTVESACNHIFSNIEETVDIDTDLKNIKVNTYIGKDISKIDAMAMLAIACCGYWKFERDGSYSLKKYKIPAITNDLDYDKLWKKPSVSQGEKYTACKVKYYKWDSTASKLVETEVIVSDDANDGSTYVVSQSYFICSESQARQVGVAALAYAQQRLTHEASYRGDPSIEAGDSVTIENDFENSPVIVLKHVINFDSTGLTGNIVGLGV